MATMPFDTLSERLKQVADRALLACKQRYGGNGVKIEEGIDNAIMWRPTFYLKPSKVRVVAVEVEDNLYPGSLRGAAHEIGLFDAPIMVFQACTLEAYLADPKQKNVSLLRDHGFGIITVDEDGNVVVQQACIPLAQHIPPSLLEKEIGPLSPQLKVGFRSAYEVYKTSETQGLQAAGQIVEAIVSVLAVDAHKKGLLKKDKQGNVRALPGQLALRIDELYDAFPAHRATLGEARSFVGEYRNTASHPADSAKRAAERIRKCRAGFLQAVALCAKLKVFAKATGTQVRVHL
jgi:hypothetical protein